MNIFNQIRVKKPKSNKFDLSHEKKMSLNMGDLIPIYLEEIVPGDRFKTSSEILIRMAPMLAPIMHRVNVYTHYFFVPNRIVWDNWKTFITGGEDGQQEPVYPTINIAETVKQMFAQGTLADYLGLPVLDQTKTITGSTARISALPFRAYAEIYNEYYRDQNLEAAVEFSKGDGPAGGATEALRLGTLRKRAWEKDYFTSALPWAQRGGEVNLPVESQFQPVYKDITDVFQTGTSTPSATGSWDLAGGGQVQDVNSTKARIENLSTTQQVQSTSVTINELRTATRLQEWLEKNARGGSRYIEQILSHFGVRSSDARLQRPEYLGGGKNPVVISEVLNQAGDAPQEQEPTNPLAPVGTQYGHGISVGRSNGFSKSFEEHGYVMGIMSVIPRTGYQQGMERTWRKFNKLDYYWPEFAHLGEQEIRESEIYMDYQQLPEPEDEPTFGYTPRYAEYKYKQTSVHGEFRQTGTTPATKNLSYWHMARYFDGKPALNSTFVQSNPTRDIFAVTDENVDTLYCQIYHKVSAIRPMPYFGTPYL